MRKAAFFDRDGTINVDVGYLHDARNLVFVKGIPELIKQHNDAGDLVIVISNQSGIARGMFKEKDVQALHNVMNQRLQAEYGAHIDAFYICPHLPEITGDCDCRKPKPGLFLRAIKEYDIDPAVSISYGDKNRDKEASLAAGIGQFVFVNCE